MTSNVLGLLITETNGTAHSIKPIGTENKRVKK
jgi:hypothetical protein